MKSNLTRNRKYGDFGETLAAMYLRLHGASVIERNYVCPYGEIDIIALREGRVCFVEVKRRSSDAYGTPAQAVDGRKRRHIVNSAMCFLKGRGWADRPVSFDVIEIERLKITCIRGAFDADV